MCLYHTPGLSPHTHRDVSQVTLMTRCESACSSHGFPCDCVRQEGLQMLKREEGLASLLQPDYVWIFKQLGRTEGGVKFLVDMRAHLLVR